VGDVKVEVHANAELDVHDQLKHMTKLAHQLDAAKKAALQECDELRAQLENCKRLLHAAEEKSRADRRLTESEVSQNKKLVASVLATELKVDKSPQSPIERSSTSPARPVHVVSESAPQEHAKDDKLSQTQLVLEENIMKLDRAALGNLCMDLCKQLAIVNSEKNRALLMHSQSSSTAAAFAASRFGPTRRKSFEAKGRSIDPITDIASTGAAKDNYSSPQQAGPGTGSASVAGRPQPASLGTLFASPGDVANASVAPAAAGGLHATAEDKSPGLTPDHLHLPGAAGERKPSMEKATSMDNAPPDNLTLIKAETLIIDSDSVARGRNSTPDTLDGTDAFIDMLIFGDVFYKFGGFTKHLRHVSVSTDLSYLCWGHVDNSDAKSMKKISLVEMDRCAHLLCVCIVIIINVIFVPLNF
jgi:hypothetical protein